MDADDSPFNSSLFPKHDSSTLRGQCKWSPLNSALSGFLVLTFSLNIVAAFVIFRVPLVSTRGRCNPVYLCIRFLNSIDLAQVRGDWGSKGWGLSGAVHKQARRFMVE